MGRDLQERPSNIAAEGPVSNSTLLRLVYTLADSYLFTSPGRAKGEGEMMSYVFWDTETTGISTSFDQILQFAAVKTDAEFNELDRIELRCRLHPHVAPNPGALRVTGMSIEQITDPALPCHYDMVRQVRARFLEWSPAIFIGYNSIKFDEELFRKALFRTLHSPYLTNTSGNGRADAMNLVQAAAALQPGCLEVPTGDNGKSVFKLDRLAPANGFDYSNAHDAMADVLATVHLARCVSERAPEVFSRFVRFAMKSSVAAFLEEEDAVLLTEYYFSRPYHFVVAPFGSDPDNPAKVYCLDLKHDLDWVASLPPDQLAVWVNRSPKPVRSIRTNAPPALAAIDEVAEDIFGPLSPDLIAERARRLRDDPDLCDRIMDAVMASAVAYEDPAHVEEQLYSGGFVQPADQALIDRFHEVPWSDRPALVDQMQDPRLRYHGLRLMYEHDVHLLSGGDRREVEDHMWDRLLMEECPKGKWASLVSALAETEAMIEEGDLTAMEMLEGLRAHLLARIEDGRNYQLGAAGF